MGTFYDKPNHWKTANKEGVEVGQARYQQFHDSKIKGLLDRHFKKETLHYLDEAVINHLQDSLTLEHEHVNGHYNDYSFLIAPAYKALEGFLFQIARDLGLPCSGKNDAVGAYYYDEQKIDKHMNALFKQLEQKADSPRLLKDEKRDIKDRVTEMSRVLRTYRHSPAHFLGERMLHKENAISVIGIIYHNISVFVEVFQRVGLLQSPKSSNN